MASAVTSRRGGRALIRAASVGLALSRLGSYAAVLLGAVPALFVLRLVGAVCGAVLVNGAKGQVPASDNASTSLAWLNVANGAGQAIASVLAGFLSAAAPVVIAVVATPIVVVATVPMLRLATSASPLQVDVRDQVRSLRSALDTAVVGALVMSLLSAPLLLADGLATEEFGAGWLGPLSLMGFGGGLAAAWVLPRITRQRISQRHDPVLWSSAAAVGLLLWTVSDVHPGLLLAGRFLAGVAAGFIGASIEARILQRVPADRAVPALAGAAGLTGAATAAMAWVAPVTIEALGVRGLTLLCLVGIGLVAVVGSFVGRLDWRRTDPVPAS